MKIYDDLLMVYDDIYCYRAVKSDRMPYLHRSFSAKEPYNWWLFCGE